jgi:DNA invertase Pin-like site-specific DNA recombinase
LGEGGRGKTGLGSTPISSQSKREKKKKKKKVNVIRVKEKSIKHGQWNQGEEKRGTTREYLERTKNGKDERKRKKKEGGGRSNPHRAPTVASQKAVRDFLVLGSSSAGNASIFSDGAKGGYTTVWWRGRTV